jgi:hypothetical protein
MKKRPSTVSILLSVVPFVGMCFSVPLWDRVTPRVLGLPFNMAWIVGWLLLSPALMGIVYRLEKGR